MNSHLAHLQASELCCTVPSPGAGGAGGGTGQKVLCRVAAPCGSLHLGPKEKQMGLCCFLKQPAKVEGKL